MKQTWIPAALGALLAGGCVALDADADAETGASAAALDGELPTPGRADAGDTLFPLAGNGGYDVALYDLALRYTADPTAPVIGDVAIHARATQALSRFNLDFAGDTVAAVTVDGQPARFVRDGGELVITPARPLRRHAAFVVRVSGFVATPRVASPDALLGAPLFSTVDGTGWALQPTHAHHVFPSNDHPSDKARYRFRLDVPAGTTAVASGVLVDRRTHAGRSVFRYHQAEPMATELAQVVVGAFTVTSRGVRGGVIQRDVTPTRLDAALVPKLAIAEGQLAALVGELGPYPFAAYGTLAMDADLGFALETQTLSLFPTAYFLDYPEADYAPLMVHELAHQWFGNSVSPARWSDVWLNEGHASWYELVSQYPADSASFVALMRALYRAGDLYRALFGPVALPPSGDPAALFSAQAYAGGALVLFALRQQVGAEAFRAIQRAWVSDLRGRAASSQDFIALASRVAGQDLSGFLDAWLYGASTPAMPGHPDWTVDPVLRAALPPASRATSAALLAEVGLHHHH